MFPPGVPAAPSRDAVKKILGKCYAALAFCCKNSQ